MKNINRMVPTGLIPVSVAIASLLAGCGGGGSAGFTAAPVAITTVNAPQVAAQAALVSGAMGATGSSSGGATGSSVNAQVSGLNPLAVLSDSVKWLSGAPAPTSRRMVSMVTPQAAMTTACLISGTYTINIQSASAASLTYSSCVDSATSGTFNGSMSLSGLVVSDPNFIPPWDMSAHMSVSNFSIDDGLHVYILNGSSTLTDAMQSDGITENLGMSGGPLEIAIDGHASTLYDYSMLLEENLNSLSYITSLDGTLVSDLLGGRVTLDTTVAFTGVNLDLGSAEAGSMTITGAGNSSVKLTATGGGAVTLRVDADGDGVVDSNGTTTTTWDDLAALL